MAMDLNKEGADGSKCKIWAVTCVSSFFDQGRSTAWGSLNLFATTAGCHFSVAGRGEIHVSTPVFNGAWPVRCGCREKVLVSLSGFHRMTWFLLCSKLLSLRVSGLSFIHILVDFSSLICIRKVNSFAGILLYNQTEETLTRTLFDGCFVVLRHVLLPRFKMIVRGFPSEWYISTMIYSRDIPFWSETLEYIMCNRKVHVSAWPLNGCCSHSHCEWLVSFKWLLRHNFSPYSSGPTGLFWLHWSPHSSLSSGILFAFGVF